jgi:hypothetical protein
MFLIFAGTLTLLAGTFSKHYTWHHESCHNSGQCHDRHSQDRQEGMGGPMTSRASRLSSSSISTALSVPARFRMPNRRSLISTTCRKPCLQQDQLIWSQIMSNLGLLSAGAAGVCMLCGSTWGAPALRDGHTVDLQRCQQIAGIAASRAVSVWTACCSILT